MIAIITLLILLICFAYFYSKLSKKGLKFFDPFKFLHTEFKKSTESKQSEKKILLRLLKAKIIILYATFILFIILLISSFIPTAFTGEHLSGLFLIIHVTFAPIFALTLAILLLLYSYPLKLRQSDYENLSDFKKETKETQNSIVKLTFWMLALISIPLLLSIILILYPILGTDSQNFNIIVHRISALIFTILVLVLIYFYFNSKKVA